MPNHSPYSYALNNPVRYEDIWGMTPKDKVKKRKKPKQTKAQRKSKRKNKPWRKKLAKLFGHVDATGNLYTAKKKKSRSSSGSTSSTSPTPPPTAEEERGNLDYLNPIDIKLGYPELDMGLRTPSPIQDYRNKTIVNTTEALFKINDDEFLDGIEDDLDDFLDPVIIALLNDPTLKISIIVDTYGSEELLNKIFDNGNTGKQNLINRGSKIQLKIEKYGISPSRINYYYRNNRKRKEIRIIGR